MMDNFEDLTPKTMLGEINKAIAKVLAGGQSYKIGSRSLTRADLSELRKLKSDLESELSESGESDLFGNTVVAFFDGR